MRYLWLAVAAAFTWFLVRETPAMMRYVKMERM